MRYEIVPGLMGCYDLPDDHPAHRFHVAGYNKSGRCTSLHSLDGAAEDETLPTSIRDAARKLLDDYEKGKSCENHSTPA